MLVGFADVQPLLSVAAILGALLIGSSWLSKRVRAMAGARSSVALTGQHAVHVIELDGERLLIGTGPSGAPRLLTRLPARPAEATEPAPETWIDRALGALRDRTGGRLVAAPAGGRPAEWPPSKPAVSEANGALRDRTGGRLVPAPPAGGRPAEWPPSKPAVSEANGVMRG
jgi:hypothetical protein